MHQSSICHSVHDMYSVVIQTDLANIYSLDSARTEGQCTSFKALLLYQLTEITIYTQCGTCNGLI